MVEIKKLFMSNEIEKINHKSKLYKKKIENFLGFQVWLVDAEYLRANVCEDFVKFGQHLRFNFIPKNELWIDSRTEKSEIQFYIDHMIIENRMMSEGVDYGKAYKIANKLQRIERSKTALAGKLKREDKKHLIEDITLKILKKNKKITIRVVSGEKVRDVFNPDFGGGGHDRVYHFIPENEVWIDDNIPADERKFVLIHELRERRVMKNKTGYPFAHRKATIIEDFCRKNPKLTDAEIKKELEKQ